MHTMEARQIELTGLIVSRELYELLHYEAATYLLSPQFISNFFKTEDDALRMLPGAVFFNFLRNLNTPFEPCHVRRVSMQ